MPAPPECSIYGSIYARTPSETLLGRSYSEDKPADKQKGISQQSLNNQSYAEDPLSLWEVAYTFKKWRDMRPMHENAHSSYSRLHCDQKVKRLSNAKYERR